jgi:hypothetical protein
MQEFQELADEAFSDLLRKHGRPTELKAALRQSVSGMEKRHLRARSSVAADGRPPATTTGDLEWVFGPEGSTSRLALPS